jgi:hypothetical protein
LRPSNRALLLRQQSDSDEVVPAEDECLCSNSPPDYFGNQHHIVNPACPLCANGPTEDEGC